MIDISALYGKRIFLTGSTGLVGTAIHNHLEGLCDLTDPLKHPVAQGIQADYIIHAAGYGQPEKFIADPVSTIRVNTEKTIDLLKRLKPGGKFLYVSTSELYSGSPKALHDEHDIGSTDPWDYRACYIEAKRCGEAICAAFRSKGSNVKVARLALAYGPGTKPHDSRVLNQFIEQALVNKRIELKDSGAAIRTYGYIDDMVEMLFGVLIHGGESFHNPVENLTLPYIDRPVYNVGGVSRVTIRELAERIGLLTGTEVFVPTTDNGQHGAPAHVALDLTKYHTEIHAKTDFVDLHEGLKRTIEYQRELYAV